MFDDRYDEGFQAGKDAAKSEKQDRETMAALFSVVGIVLKILFGILTVCIIYSGALMTAHLFLKFTGKYDNSGTWEYMLWLFGLGYIVTCLLFYIKGIMIVGKAERKWWWIPIFLLCLFVICVMPALVFQGLLESWMGPSQRTGEGGLKYYILFSWAGALLIAAFIYQRFQLTKDYVLTIAGWSYLLGIKTARSLLK